MAVARLSPAARCNWAIPLPWAVPSGFTPLQLTGGVVDLAGQAVTAGGLTGNGGTVTSTSNGGVLFLTLQFPATYSGTITGKAGITLNAPGNTVQTLAAANNYTGPTNLITGTLALAAPGTLGSGLTAIYARRDARRVELQPRWIQHHQRHARRRADATGGTDVNGSLNMTGRCLASLAAPTAR